MATAGFWPVKGNLKDVIKYAENPDKTTNSQYNKDLADTLKYVKNSEKTDMQLYVSGINCTAKHMWGKDYEIVVTTHINTGSLHNHFVINSVSFKTGNKFENHVSDHIKLREIFDSICEEHGKSVLKRFYKSGKKEYWIHKRGGLTHRDILRRDVDRAITQSANLLEFKQIVENMGYRFNRSILSEHPSVILRSWERPIRIDSLGENYTRDAIMRRTAENRFKVNSYESKQRIRNAKPKHTPLQEIEYQMRRMRYMGALEAVLYIIVELLTPMKENKSNYTPPLSPSLRQELVKFELYKKQFRLLCDNDIHTAEELAVFIGSKKTQINELEYERSLFDNKRRRAKTDDELEEYKQEKRKISAGLKPIREQLRLAESIMENIPRLENYLEAERILESKIKQKERQFER